MKIVVCYKNVPDEQDIAVRADHTLDFSNAEWKIGQYDLNAIEAGMNLAKETEAEVVVLTAAGDVVDNSKLRKAVLSRGPAEMFAVKDAAMDTADSYATAAVLKSGVEKVGDVDLVLCGEGSGDIYAQQVGPMLGAMLGWPTVNAVSRITPKGGKLLVERDIESGVEELEVPLPAVLAVTSDINLPRIPGMKDILGAGKKPVTVWELADVGASVQNASETVSILAPEQTDRLGVILEGDSEENIETLFGHLRKMV